jgi:perosamine synthetase
LKKNINFEPYVNIEEKYQVVKTLRRGILSSGKTTKIFEKKISKFLGIKYVVACSSGTAALHIALIANNINRQHEVLLPSMSFIATANAVRYVGAKPVFFDCDEYFNINVRDVINFIKFETVFKKGNTINKKSKKKISCIVIAHMWGNAVNFDNLYYLCKKRNILVIEDAAESFGSKYVQGKFKNKFCGTIGNIGCISFNGNKIITTGGGGAILCKTKKIYQKCKYYINQAKENNNKFIHDNIGYNYRLSDIQSAVGIAQISKIKKILKLKNLIYVTYQKKIKKLKNFEVYSTPEYSFNNKWMVCVKIINKKISFDKIYKRLIRNRIFIRPIWFPIHLQKPYKNFQKYNIKNTFKMYKNSFCLPSYPSLKKKQIEEIVKILGEI